MKMIKVIAKFWLVYVISTARGEVYLYIEGKEFPLIYCLNQFDENGYRIVVLTSDPEYSGN